MFESLPDRVKSADQKIFYFFVMGAFKDHGADVQNQFWFIFFSVFLCLIMEKQSINWLTNRWGCNYNKLQKFIELDLRKKSIHQDWPRNPRYSILAYKPHYFYKDFDSYQEKFIEEPDTMKNRRKAAEKGNSGVIGNKEVRDFIPYRVALRASDFITFTVKLGGRAPDLNYGEEEEQTME